MSDKYNWDDLCRDMEELGKWLAQKPKWWQFRKMRIWKMQDPRKFWR